MPKGVYLDPDYQKKYNKKYYLNNKERLKEYYKCWRERKGKDYDRNKYPEYRARKLSNNKKYFERLASAVGDFKKNLQQAYENNIKKFGCLTCEYCGDKLIFGNDCVDHKIPLIRGGDNKLENLSISCIYCNAKKGTKTLSEWKE